MPGPTITGTATAPGGAVAQFKDFSLLQWVANLFAADVAAAIIGLEPVTGATVDLIRIDNDGNQVGEVLATTSTSLTGQYTLTLPTGVSLAGNLIVRITGSGSDDLRAQVVDETVNISPVSEFILRKFIADDADLATLEPGAVVTLSGQAEDFDLTAGSDLSALFEQLEFSLGEFIDSQIDAIQIASADATNISGDYRSAALHVALGDNNGGGFGSFAFDMWFSNFTFTGNANGTVVVEQQSEESAWAYVHGNDVSDTQLSYEARIENEAETLQANFNSANLLMVEGEFEEEIDGDFGWRWPPVTYRLQKVRDQNLFFLLSQEAAVRFAAVDTDDDTIKDAVDPSMPAGNEVTRGIEVFIKKPTEMTTADLTGTFGRVYFGASMQVSGHVELEMETNELVFNNGLFDYGAAIRNRISRNSAGVTDAQTETTLAEEDMSITLGPDGDILTIAGEPADGYVNDAANLVVFAESVGEDTASANFSKTFLVKLPTSAPTVDDKRYRLMVIGTEFQGTAFEVNHSRFNSFIDWTSNTAGTLSLEATSLTKASLGANVIPMAHPAEERTVAGEIAANGAATINITDAEGTLRLKGYWNETASYGVFTAGYIPNGETVFKSIGLAVLTEVTE